MKKIRAYSEAPQPNTIPLIIIIIIIITPSRAEVDRERDEGKGIEEGVKNRSIRIFGFFGLAFRFSNQMFDYNHSKCLTS